MPGPEEEGANKVLPKDGPPLRSTAGEGPTAHEADCLWLLDFSPDQVYRSPLQGPLAGGRPVFRAAPAPAAFDGQTRAVFPATSQSEGKDSFDPSPLLLYGLSTAASKGAGPRRAGCAGPARRRSTGPGCPGHAENSHRRQFRLAADAARRRSLRPAAQGRKRHRARSDSAVPS